MRCKALSFLAVAAALAFALCGPADASTINVCAPSAPGAALGPAQVKAPTSGTQYSINSRGCVNIALTDLGDFQSMGYTTNAGLSALIVNTGVLSSTTSVQLGTLPASTYISAILIENTTANAITGGIDIGKTTGAADIVSAKACAANCLTSVLDSAILLRNFSTTAAQAIWLTGHTSGNSANLNVTIIYGYF